jgi:hypothetical protein
MEKRPRYNPFEQLKDFPDLKSLTRHILESVEVTEVVVRLPDGFDTTLIRAKDVLLPVADILVGNATFNYIRLRAEYIINEVKSRIALINQDDSLSFEDRFSLFKEVQKAILKQYYYFDSMNLIRYMTAYKWRIAYLVEVDGKTEQKVEDFVNSKIDLTEGHWNILDNTFAIRKHLLYEILILIDTEVSNLTERLTETSYKWKGKSPYDMHELALALIKIGRLEIIKGDENTFIHDFLKFFGITDEKLSRSKGKVLDRQQRSQFLIELEEALDRR